VIQLWKVWVPEGATEDDAAVMAGTRVNLTEWRCFCPSNPDFDKSMNPNFVSACNACGAERPEPRCRKCGGLHLRKTDDKRYAQGLETSR
jgi:ribosomal protein L40E